jgi:hypothetical protein
MSIDAMKTALEALEMLAKWEHPASNITTKSGRIYPHHVAKNAAATLRLAIEQAEKQEPVAKQLEQVIAAQLKQFYAPPQRQPHELLCVCGASWSIDSEGNEELLSTPPQRQPLTDGELRRCFLATNTTEPLAEGWPGLERFARAIERKHGIGGKHD